MHPPEDWSACQSVGVSEFDHDHEAMLAVARTLRDVLADDIPSPEVQPLLDELLELALAHFESEEQLLRDTAYPHLTEHVQSHNRLLRAMLHFKEDVRHTRYRAELAVKFIHAWVVEHVRVEDSRYAEHVQRARARPLQAAAP
jgi:hemerythrin